MLSLLVSWTLYAQESTDSDNFPKIDDSPLYIFPPNLESNLILPDCHWTAGILKDDGTILNTTMCARTIDEEDTVLRIYLGYTLAMKYRPKIESILNFDTKLINLCNRNQEIASKTIKEQQRYNEHLMKTFRKRDEEAREEKRKAKLRNFLWGGGGLLVGAGIGILIGVFI